VRGSSIFHFAFFIFHSTRSPERSDCTTKNEKRKTKNEKRRTKAPRDLLALANNPAGCDPVAAILFQSLSPLHVRIGAAYRFDRLTQAEIAEKFHVDQSTVSRHLEAVARAMQRLGIPEPEQMPKPDTRHVRQLGDKTYASL